MPPFPPPSALPLAHGTFLNAATANYPTVVLGAEAVTLLGITSLTRPTKVWIGGRWFTVVGIRNPVQLIALPGWSTVMASEASEHEGVEGLGSPLRAVLSTRPPAFA